MRRAALSLTLAALLVALVEVVLSLAGQTLVFGTPWFFAMHVVVLASIVAAASCVPVGAFQSGALLINKLSPFLPRPAYLALGLCLAAGIVFVVAAGFIGFSRISPATYFATFWAVALLSSAVVLRFVRVPPSGVVAGDGPPEFTKPSCLGVTNTLRIMRSTIRCATTVFLASILLSGCGGSGSDSSDSTPSPSAGETYGTLTLTGSGSAITGTTFTARTRLGLSQSGMTVTQWYSINLGAGTTYPYIVLIIVQDSAGTVTGIDITNMTSETTGSGKWVKAPLSASEVSATVTAVSFTNLVVPGYGSAPATSLSLNGTLRFQPE